MKEIDVREGTGDLSPCVISAMSRLARESRLSPALETRLLEIAAGRTYQAIAESNGVTVATVKTQAQHLFRVLGVNSCAEIRNAIRAADVRAAEGHNEERIFRFLRLRFE